MNRKLTLALVTVAGIGLGAGAVASLDAANAAAGWGKRHHAGMTRFCEADRAGKLDDVLAFADSFLKLDDAQRQAWNGLAASLRGANGRIDTACADLGDATGLSAPAKLARVETMLGTGLDIVREVRPSFDAFYGTLDAEQKAALDRLIERRRH